MHIMLDVEFRLLECDSTAWNKLTNNTLPQKKAAAAWLN
jgi:hypothetical protein